ncbi:indolepyruvate ferredoxin oxidoreductase [compost metagenome]
MARELLKNYEDDLVLINECTGRQQGIADALALASLPEKIRGYGHVRADHANKIAGERVTLRERLRNVLSQGEAPKNTVLECKESL